MKEIAICVGRKHEAFHGEIIFCCWAILIRRY